MCRCDATVPAISTCTLLTSEATKLVRIMCSYGLGGKRNFLRCHHVLKHDCMRCRYALVTVQRLTEVLQRGPPEQRPPTLLLLRCLLEAPGLRLGPGALYPATLFAPVATLLHGPCASDALKVGFKSPGPHHEP